MYIFLEQNLSHFSMKILIKSYFLLLNTLLIDNVLQLPKQNMLVFLIGLHGVLVILTPLVLF